MVKHQKELVIADIKDLRWFVEAKLIRQRWLDRVEAMDHRWLVKAGTIDQRWLSRDETTDWRLLVRIEIVDQRWLVRTWTIDQKLLVGTIENYQKYNVLSIGQTSLNNWLERTP